MRSARDAQSSAPRSTIVDDPLIRFRQTTEWRAALPLRWEYEGRISVARFQRLQHIQCRASKGPDAFASLAVHQVQALPVNVDFVPSQSNCLASSHSSKRCQTDRADCLPWLSAFLGALQRAAEGSIFLWEGAHLALTVCRQSKPMRRIFLDKIRGRPRAPGCQTEVPRCALPYLSRPSQSLALEVRSSHRLLSCRPSQK